MSPRAGRPPKPRLPCDEENLTRLLRSIEDAHQELEDWLAVYADEPGTSAKVLMALRRNLHGVQRTAEAMWRDAHDQEIEQAIEAERLRARVESDSGERHDLVDVLADLDQLPRRPTDRFTIIRGEKP